MTFKRAARESRCMRAMASFHMKWINLHIVPSDSHERVSHETSRFAPAKRGPSESLTNHCAYAWSSCELQAPRKLELMCQSRVEKSFSSSSSHDKNTNRINCSQLSGSVKVWAQAPQTKQSKAKDNLSGIKGTSSQLKSNSPRRALQHTISPDTR